MLAYENWLNITEKSEVPAQTPPFKGGVLAGTALFSLATVVAYGGERVNFFLGNSQTVPVPTNESRASNDPVSK